MIVTSAPEWPPAGHSLTYDTVVKLDHLDEPIRFSLTVPRTTETVDIATAIVGRIGGPSREDLARRERIYAAVGAAVVAAGRVEAAMKRLVIVLQENRTGTFHDVDKTWSELEKLLDAELAKPDPGGRLGRLRKEVAAHLAWARGRGLKTHRDNIVHGYIWDYDMPALVISRFKRKHDPKQLVATDEDLRHWSDGLSEYADRLDRSLHGIWAQAMLPASESRDAFGRP